MIKTGLVSLKGDLKIRCGNADDTELKHIDILKNGDIGIFMRHPESWLTDTAKDIIDSSLTWKNLTNKINFLSDLA